MFVELQDVIYTCRPPCTENYVFGIVLENKDPLKYGRIKVKIPKIIDPAFIISVSEQMGTTQEDYPTTANQNGGQDYNGTFNRTAPQTTGIGGGGIELLPWVNRFAASFMGGKPETGEFAVPEIGSTVMIVFKNLIVYEAFYIATDTSKHHKSSKYDKEYPKSYGYDDGNGTWWRCTKDDDWIFHHRSGYQFHIDKDGNVDEYIPGYYNRHVGRGTTITDDIFYHESAPDTNINGDEEPDG